MYILYGGVFRILSVDFQLVSHVDHVYTNNQWNFTPSVPGADDTRLN